MKSAIAGLLTTANIAIIYLLLNIIAFQKFYLWVNIAMPLTCLVITITITFMLKYFLSNKDYEKTYALATTDSMTGLYNHRFFQDHMRHSIEQSNRFKHKFSLLLIDIDFFKKFNDSHGHQAGDEVLRQVARKLKKNVRTVDVVARYGGEEMAIILDRANEEEALLVAQKIVRAIAEEAYPIAEGVSKHITISCGVSTYPTHGETPSQLIEFSDLGLYRAKENGRNQVGAQYDALPPDGGESHGKEVRVGMTRLLFPGLAAVNGCNDGPERSDGPTVQRTLRREGDREKMIAHAGIAQHPFTAAVRRRHNDAACAADHDARAVFYVHPV